MRKYWFLALVAIVAGLSFSIGRFYNPSFRFKEFPEIGELRMISGKTCVPGVPSVTPVSTIVESVDYSPGDSSGVQVLVWRRTSTRASILMLESKLEDDEVDAEGKEYELEWSKAGWRIVGCRAVVRYYPGRP